MPRGDAFDNEVFDDDLKRLNVELARRAARQLMFAKIFEPQYFHHPDAKQLDIIKRGMETWNTWRAKKENEYAYIALSYAELNNAKLHNVDLSDANLFRAKIECADLSQANLTKTVLYQASLVNSNLSEANLAASVAWFANLAGADLTKANLVHSDLVGVDLTKTNLEGTNLESANLTRANLTGANLARANLKDTLLNEANLSEANLESAVLSGTILNDTILKETKKLESCIHHGPSFLDYKTLARSGKLPLTFLRGCGLPDNLMKYLPTLLTESSTNFYSCFISYSHEDEEFAKYLHNDLQNNGVRCWFAPEDLKIGDKFRAVIDQSIHTYDKLLLILSRHSIRSAWVEKEVEAAFEKERMYEKTVLFPIRLDDAIMKTNQSWAADIRRTRHIGDFSKWSSESHYNESFDHLLRDLNVSASISGDKTEK